MVVNRMKTPIESDSRGVTSVVDEAIDGTKAIPMVLVTKNANGLYEYVSGSGGGGGTGAQGPDGLSAYEVAVKNGYVGTESAWLASLKGATGERGPQGVKGDTGATGPAGAKGDTGAQGPQGVKGDTGATGPQGVKGGTGATGPQGLKGDKGDIGPAGPSGFGTEAQYNDIIARLVALETPTP